MIAGCSTTGFPELLPFLIPALNFDRTPRHRSQININCAQPECLSPTLRRKKNGPRRSPSRVCTHVYEHLCAHFCADVCTNGCTTCLNMSPGRPCSRRSCSRSRRIRSGARTSRSCEPTSRAYLTPPVSMRSSHRRARSLCSGSAVAVGKVQP